ncbi:MAG: hypothetical protein WD178_09420, partial [Actinomycetota bacterium]
NLELAYLNETGKLKVSGAAIFLDLQERIGLMESSQSLAAVVAAAADQSWTRDPFDRLIVGDSLSANCTLLSKDATILAHCGLAEW